MVIRAHWCTSFYQSPNTLARPRLTAWCLWVLLTPTSPEATLVIGMHTGGRAQSGRSQWNWQANHPPGWTVWRNGRYGVDSGEILEVAPARTPPHHGPDPAYGRQWSSEKPELSTLQSLVPPAPRRSPLSKPLNEDWQWSVMKGIQWTQKAEELAHEDAFSFRTWKIGLTLDTLCLDAETIITGYVKSQVGLISVRQAFVLLPRLWWFIVWSASGSW